MEVLPIPGGAAELEFDSLGIPGGLFGLVFFLSISPGIMEELLFRGALLESMKRDWRWPRIIGWQALFFGLIHLNIYRLAPTAILGALLAGLALRTRSVVPAILVHITYNGLTVLGGRAEADPDAANEWLAVNVLQADWFVHAPWAAIPDSRSSRSSVARATDAERCRAARSRAESPPRGRPGDRAVLALRFDR